MCGPLSPRMQVEYPFKVNRSFLSPFKVLPSGKSFFSAGPVLVVVPGETKLVRGELIPGKRMLKLEATAGR